MFGTSPTHVVLLSMSLLFASCGGGGGAGGSGGGVGGGGGGGGPPAPSGITYPASSISYSVGVPAQAIKPKVGGGAVSAWSISPSLPAGLVFSATDGSIS